MRLPTFVKTLAKAVLRQPICAPLVAIWVSKRVRILFDCDDASALNVLTFDSWRWEQDILALSKVGGVRLLAMDDDAINWIVAFFNLPHVKANELYYRETDKRILKRRRESVAYMAIIMGLVKRWKSLNCATNPNATYVRTSRWMQACVAADLPFVAIHKEYTVLDTRQIQARSEEWAARGVKFFGTHICVNNENAKSLLFKAGVAPLEKITVSGLLRADNLVGPKDQPLEPDQPKRTVTLFSFGHLTGPFDPPMEIRSHYFSLHGNFGFIELFRDVHVAFAELALRHPEIEFKIKPKNVEQWWTDEVEWVLRDELGLSLADIPNCNMVGDWAPDLMRDSLATIVLNSTVVLESRILGCNTIMPLFAEAAGVHSDRIYFDQFTDLFAVATSKQDLVDKLEHAIGGGSLAMGSDERLREMRNYYLGNSDGRSAERLIDVFRDVMADRNPNDTIDAMSDCNRRRIS
jgi:hypothetical protein